MVIDSENQKIYCFGGRIIFNFENNNFSSGFYQYNIENNNWTNIE
jgi:hypothetical protein